MAGTRDPSLPVSFEQMPGNGVCVVAVVVDGQGYASWHGGGTGNRCRESYGERGWPAMTTLVWAGNLQDGGERERGGEGYIRKEEVTEGWRETEILYNETKKTV